MEHIIKINELEINPSRHEASINDTMLELTLKEFELLKFMAENRGHVFTRDQLLDKVWGIDYAGETRTVDVHIRYLRKKLGEAENEEESNFIQTIRGKGYKMI